MVYRFVACLSCDWRSHNVAAEDFVDDLVLSAEDAIEGVYSNGGRGATSRVAFRLVHLYDFEDAEEPTEDFAAAVQERILQVAEFLDRQSPSVFDQFRERGLKVYLYMEVRMDQDQMQLTLPSRLLSACARLDLGIELISNDISAAEAAEAGWV